MAINIVDRIIEDYQAMSMPEEDLGFDPVKYRMENGKIVPKGVGALLIDEEKYRTDIDGYSAIVPPSGTKKQTRESYIKAWNEMPAHYPRDWTSLQKWAYGNKSKSELKAKAEELGRMSPEERQSFWESGKSLRGDSNLKYAPYAAIVGVPENTQSVLKQTADYMELGYSKEGAKAQIERDFIGSQVVRRHNQKAEDWSFQKVVFAVGALAIGGTMAYTAATGGLAASATTPADLASFAAGATETTGLGGITGTAAPTVGATGSTGLAGAGGGSYGGSGVGATGFTSTGVVSAAPEIATVAPVAMTTAEINAAAVAAGVTPEVLTASLATTAASGTELALAADALGMTLPALNAAATSAGVTTAQLVSSLTATAASGTALAKAADVAQMTIPEFAKQGAEEMGWLDNIWDGVKQIPGRVVDSALTDVVPSLLNTWGSNAINEAYRPDPAPGNIVQTQQRIFPDEGQPTFEAPEWNQREIDAGAQRKAGAPTRRLQDAVNRALAFSTENPNVDSMKARDTLAGYGMGLGNVMAGAEGAALGEYATKYGREYDTAKTNFDTDLTKWTDSAQIVQTQNRYDRPQPAPAGTNFGTPQVAQQQPNVGVGLPDWLRNQIRNP